VAGCDLQPAGHGVPSTPAVRREAGAPAPVPQEVDDLGKHVSAFGDTLDQTYGFLCGEGKR
jgi:hypothetical protein